MNHIASPDNSDSGIERLIQAVGATGPRITPVTVESDILAEQYHVFEGTTLTVCALTLQNGFQVTGESACAYPENFNAEIGRRIARENAKQKIWSLMGYALKQQLFEEAEAVIAESSLFGRGE